MDKQIEQTQFERLSRRDPESAQIIANEMKGIMAHATQAEGEKRESLTLLANGVGDLMENNLNKSAVTTDVGAKVVPLVVNRPDSHDIPKAA